MINNLHIKKRHIVRIAALAAAVGICACLFACDRADKTPEKITIAYATLPETALVQIAQARGYYREEGLEATAHLHPYGKRALEDLLEGNADFATVAETPVMFAVMKGEKISVIATIQTSVLGHAIIARKDRGISTLKDLKGKKIAATLGTTSHFYLDATLVAHGISIEKVRVVNLKAEDIPDALVRGDIDAVSTFTPYTAFAQKKLGDNVITFHDKDIYTYNFNVVSTQEFIHNNPKKVRKMLHALVRAEEFAKGNPAEAQRITADFSKIDIGIVRDIWGSASFNVTLAQSLILALEDESQWAIKNRLTKATKVPNYLDYVYIDGLKSVKPEAVRILR
jgi:NitT/TauT family transport system substrate-binding protein